MRLSFFSPPSASFFRLVFGFSPAAWAVHSFFFLFRFLFGHKLRACLAKLRSREGGSGCSAEVVHNFLIKFIWDPHALCEASEQLPRALHSRWMNPFWTDCTGCTLANDRCAAELPSGRSGIAIFLRRHNLQSDKEWGNVSFSSRATKKVE